jgi:DNA helicase-2/ATP-dependent DNA helicase PcrA
VRLAQAAKKDIASAVYSMFKNTDVIGLYSEFYQWIGKPEYFIRSKKMEYSDICAVLYLKIHVDGARDFRYVKHLIIDEMQDYSPVQYAILEMLFKCNKTILGDCNQSVNPLSSVSGADIQKVCNNASLMELLKSYRSTKEIAEFGRSIIGTENMVIVDRHGQKPGIIRYKTNNGIKEGIIDILQAFSHSDFKSAAVICKTHKQVDKLYGELLAAGVNITKLDALSKEYRNGIVILTAHMSKGLEFDQVIVPFCDNKTYSTEIDRQMLYIACTRAMHKLDLLFTGQPSSILPAQTSNH